MDGSVSVVVPTHNRKEMLLSVIEALEKQTYSGPMEYIIVLDGCTDGTRELLKGLDLMHPMSMAELPGMGPAAARNRGAFQAQGEYVLFLDDDIIPAPRMVAEHMDWHRRYPKSAVVGACPFGLGVRLTTLGQYGRDWWHTQYRLMAEREHQNTFRDFLTGNASLRRETFVQLGGFDEAFKHAGREDFEFGLRLLDAGYEIRFNPEAYGYHYPTDGYIRALRRNRIHGKADLVLARKHPFVLPFTDLGRFGEKGEAVRACVRWFALSFPYISDPVFGLASRWLASGGRSLSLGRLLQFSKLLSQYQYWRGIREQGGSASEIRKLTEEAGVSSPARRPLKLLRRDAMNALREIGDMENYCAALVLVSSGEIAGWAVHHSDRSDACISARDLSRSIACQLAWHYWCIAGRRNNSPCSWREDARPMTWESLSNALNVRIESRRSEAGAERQASGIGSHCHTFAADGWEPDPSWEQTVQAVLHDPEVSAVVGPALPEAVRWRGEELLWQATEMEKRLMEPPFPLGKRGSPARIALDIGDTCHWMVVRSKILGRLAGEEKASFTRLLYRLLVAEHTVVYHPGGVMWRDEVKHAGGFRQTLHASRRELGRFAAKALLLDKGSPLDVLGSIFRWARRRAMRGIRSACGRDEYPLSVGMAEILGFSMGMALETMLILTRRTNR